MQNWCCLHDFSSDLDFYMQDPKGAWGRLLRGFEGTLLLDSWKELLREHGKSRISLTQHFRARRMCHSITRAPDSHLPSWSWFGLLLLCNQWQNRIDLVHWDRSSFYCLHSSVLWKQLSIPSQQDCTRLLEGEASWKPPQPSCCVYMGISVVPRSPVKTRFRLQGWNSCSSLVFSAAVSGLGLFFNDILYIYIF